MSSRTHSGSVRTAQTETRQIGSKTRAIQGNKVKIKRSTGEVSKIWRYGVGEEAGVAGMELVTQQKHLPGNRE